LATIFATLGRLAASWAFHCAAAARYTGLPPRVAALRRSSRLTLRWKPALNAFAITFADRMAMEVSFNTGVDPVLWTS